MKRLGLDLGCRLMVFESWLVFFVDSLSSGVVFIALNDSQIVRTVCACMDVCLNSLIT